jgi:hypothetical protein
MITDSGLHFAGAGQRVGSLVHNGCRECTGQYLLRGDRRRSRHRARRELRAYRGDD